MSHDKKCCPNCFGDAQLEKMFFPFESEGTGTCSYCKTKHAELRRPESLKAEFTQLLDVYQKDQENGVEFVPQIKKDWKLFSNGKLSEAEAKDLLADIFDDGNILRGKFSPRVPDDDGDLELLKQFRETIIYENRWFINGAVPGFTALLERIEKFRDYLQLDLSTLDQTWHRVRLTEEGKILPPKEMGAPPATLSSSGRTNPLGIPYLYLASTEQTAVVECRPRPAESLVIAKFTKIDKTVADLRNPRASMSPFGISDSEDIQELRQILPTLEYIGKQLSQPVSPDRAQMEYIPIQYFCEFFKSIGFEGVLHRSAVAGGDNLVLFEHDDLEARSTQLHQVDSIQVGIGDALKTAPRVKTLFD